MGEYIDRRKTIDVIKHYAYKKIDEGFAKLDFTDKIVDIISLVENLLKEDVAPVKHGKWIKTETNLNLDCSNCNVRIARIKFNYCPNCGAKMDLEE